MPADYENPQDIHTVGRNLSDIRPARILVLLVKNQNAPPVLGMMLVGKQYDESAIYRAAFAFEQARDWKTM